jgi:IS30 family transposase
MKLPERIERTTGTQVYYANPYHSWERGTNENTNGLLRYFFPKKSSFAALTQEDIDQAVHLLNTRPRKRLNWRTPAQMLKV